MCSAAGPAAVLPPGQALEPLGEVLECSVLDKHPSGKPKCRASEKCRGAVEGSRSSREPWLPWLLLCASLLSPRACWSRVFAMALFVEHVLLGIRALMPEFEGLVKKYTLLLAKVSKAAISPLPSSADRGNSALRCGSSVTGPCPFPLQCFQHDSDMKSHPTFVAVLTVLCQCKNEVSSRLHRYWHWLQASRDIASTLVAVLHGGSGSQGKSSDPAWFCT